MQSYELVTEQPLPSDAIIVHIHDSGARISADVDRRLATIGGSISAEDHQDQLSVPAALESAISMLEPLKPHGFERICIVLHDGTEWNPAWGTLVRA